MTLQCPDCAFVARSSRTLATHRHREHPERRAGPNETAITQTLAELGRMGRLEKVDAARVQALSSMAVALDLNPFNSQMWHEYWAAIGELTAHDGGDDSVDRLLDDLSSSVRDPKAT